MGQSKSHQLAALRDRKRALAAEIAIESEAIRDSRIKLKRMQQDITRLNHQIEQLERRKDGITVTDHAVIRYLERVQGIDIDAIREQMVTDQVEQAVDTLGGTGKFPSGECRLVMDGYKVVTVEI